MSSVVHYYNHIHDDLINKINYSLNDSEGINGNNHMHKRPIRINAKRMPKRAVISKLVQDLEKKVLMGNVKAKECEELKLLKEKCCDKNAIVSLSAFHGIGSLVERQILVESQTVSMLISLLPSINQYGALVSTVGKILLLQLQTEINQTGTYACPYGMQIQHPFIMILKFCSKKSWFEIYNFVLQLIEMNEDIKVEHKIKFLRPIVRHIFWDPLWRGSKFQIKLFTALMLHSQHHKEYLHFTLEALLWQQLDIHHCMFLQELFLHLLAKENAEGMAVMCGLAPALAQATRWVIVNGYNPIVWLKILRNGFEADKASGSTVLYILTEVIMETPSVYINPLIDVCKFIIFSNYCSKYVAFKFVAVILNWFMNPSFLANPLYQNLEKIVEYVTDGTKKWNDQTSALNDNEYYQLFGKNRAEVKFVVDLILGSNDWAEGKSSVSDWLENLIDSNKRETQLKLHSFVQGMILCERDNFTVNLCLDFMLKLIGHYKEISFSHLCLLFYKLGRETDPTMQRTLLFSLPQLAVKKENISLIVGIIESLKRGSPAKTMTPLVIQLYLSLWKSDKRTYSYLHGMLHDNTATDFAWELNVSRAIALKEIGRLAPHLHAKDLVGVLSKILNECSGNVSGLPSAIAIEAVTELCKAYVIDAAGTWSAIQPKLRLDRRPRVIKSLCRFFGEVPNLNSSEQKYEALIIDIVPMLWQYTFFNDHEVIRDAFCALANFPLENLPLRLFPEMYRRDVKLPNDLGKDVKTPEDILSLPYVPAECWVQFLSGIDAEVLADGGDLVITLIERELTSLPRGVFYLPPEKAEPLSYSYLTPRSICRSLVEYLQRQAGNLTASLGHLKEMIRILAHSYSRLLPPLNWQFLENFMILDWDFLRHCMTLLAKQGQVSSSSKSILDNYFKSVEWNSQKLEEVVFVYTLLPLLCKAISFNVLQTFLENTIELTLRATLHNHGSHFHQVLHSLGDTFRNKAVQLGHKTLMARQLEKVLAVIPAEHEVMTTYARCATEFPMKSIERVTSIKDLNEVRGDWLRRAAIIKCAIAMRADIKDPLAWLSELTEAAAHFPQERDLIIKTIWAVIRGRRDCDHRNWVQEFIWRIQASITSATVGGSTVTLFLVDVFVSAAVLLSGYDCLFANADEFCLGEAKKLQIFPQALSSLLSFPDWTDMLSKVQIWLQKLLRWKELPEERARAFVEALFFLREVKPGAAENESASFFSLYSLPR